MPHLPTTVVKIGGSLYDLPNLGERLDRWLQDLPACKLFLVPGGGRTADAIRHFDQTQQLGDEASHWLALRALSLNAHVLQRTIPNSRIVSFRDQCPSSDVPERQIVDMYEFAKDDENRPDHLPHTWDVTSDSLALRMADVVGADTLYLLKSITVVSGQDWQNAADHGGTDAYFPEALRRSKRSIDIRVVNFRDLSKQIDHA